MSASQSLYFLRPYLWSPLQRKGALYIGLYRACCSPSVGWSGQGGRRRRVSTLRSGRHDSEPCKDSVAGHSADVAARIKELQDLNGLNYPRVGHGGPPSVRVPDFVRTYQYLEPDASVDREVTLYGRIHSIRRAGSKLVFIDVVSEFDRVQGLVNLGRLRGVSVEQFKDLARLLRRGDHIRLTGNPHRTARGELSLQASALPMLLSPSLVQIPETLTDAETRAQSRHVDLLVNRGAADVLRLRSAVIGAIRDFFGQRHFTEVHTPILAAGAGGAAARSFRTRHTAAATAPGEDGGAGGKELRLRIAPELWLKRLVVGGLDRVFELGPAFRDEGTDATHNPEFYTCEFYQAYASLDDLMRTTEELVMALAEMTIRLRDGTGDGIATLAALPPLEPHDLLQRIVKARPFRRVEFIPELQRRLGWTLPDLAAPEAREELLALLEMHGVPQDLVRTGDGPSLAKLLDRLAGAFLETPSAAPDVQEGSFDPAAPFFIIHHPAVLSPLAKSFCCPVTGQLVAARAELFDPSSTLRKPSSSGEDDVHQCTSTGSNSSRELANMYEEENDPFEQRRKLAAQLAERGHDDGDDSTMTVDESYVAALEAGLPPTGGWGCGIERLVMLLSGSRRIADTLSFGILRNVVGLGHAKPRKVSHGR